MLQAVAQELSDSADILFSETDTDAELFLDIEQINRQKQVYLVLKRIFDIVLSALGLIVLLPFFLIISAVIMIDDPHAGPIFVQKRVGKDGKEFRFFKFRTMIAHAEDHLEELRELNEKDGPVFKIKDDPRITRAGKFLRRTSIDELPQLINVLNGTMSLVGPRPPLPNEVAQYTPYQKQRLCITPGLTCYWQIQPNRDDLKFDDWVELDLRYITERSFFVDLKILIATAGVMFHCCGR